MMQASGDRMCSAHHRLYAQATSLLSRVPLTAAVLLLIALGAVHARADMQWTDSLDAGYLKSQINNYPMFVFIGSDRVETSRLLWKQLQSPDWNQKLANWTLVRLDSDAITPALRSLGAVGAPAIRLIAPDGQSIARHDAFASVDDFQQWFQAQQNTNAGAASPATVDTAVLLGHLDDENIAVREAAVRQLCAAPALAPEVVDLLFSGSLSQRLSAIDLLEQWHAPLSGMDAWQPGTLTPQRHLALTKWLKTRSTTTPSSVATASVNDELDAVLLASTEIESRAARQRLVKFGPAILPQVYTRLQSNSHEPWRHRLMALRYRLVATDALAALWPGGFDRLASADAEIRRAAVVDLATHVKAEDHRLLSEMFADADPFVRAQSLKLLSSLNGPQTNQELIALLADPEMNVRAAVLDTFAESPNSAVVGDLMKYATLETNTDLIVHVVHVLEETSGDEAFNALCGMLKHPQWRVRGEAAEAFTGKLRGISEAQKTHATAALVKLLDDPDGYVATRAAGTLIKCAFAESVRALMIRVPTRPELAVEVLRALAEQPALGQTYLADIQRLTSHKLPRIRASAVLALAQLTPNTCGDAMGVALKDPDVMVREAALHGAQLALVPLLPIENWPATTQNASMEIGAENLPTPPAVAAFCAGKGRPRWLADMQPDLEKSLSEPATRVPAATILCALGKDNLALPVLMAVQRGEANDAAFALDWLPWDEKLQLCRSLIAMVGVDKGSRVLEHFARVADPRMAEELWSLLGPDAKDRDFEPVYSVLQKLYFGNRYYNASTLTDEQKSRIIPVLMQRVRTGVEMQRSAALAMLLSVAPEQVIEAANIVRSDPNASTQGRIDALQIQLGQLSKDAAETTAIAALAEAPMRKVALTYLAAGPEGIEQLRDVVYLPFRSNFSSDELISDGALKVPAKLETDSSRGALHEAMHADDQVVAGYAAYFVGMTGDRSGFELLLSVWKTHEQRDPWSRLLYRVIAKNNDDQQVAVLTEIYSGYLKYGNYYSREMIATLGKMTGPNTTRFLKSIQAKPENDFFVK